MAAAAEPAHGFDPHGRLVEMGLELPPAPGPLGAYAPWIITGNILITSGQFCWGGDELAYTGRMGSDLDADQSYDACKLAALCGLAQINDALGSLDRVKQLVRLEGTMQVAEGFRDHPMALNGASDLINEVFGERGRHTRMIYANPEMPLNSPVLLVFTVEIEQPQPNSGNEGAA
jgi:enamine deaminase RidA (YjgF/YER057c/UK114 family)